MIRSAGAGAGACLRAGLAAAILISAATAARAEGFDERVTVPSLDGTALSAVFVPRTGPGPHPAVVMLHGCAGLFTKSGKIASRETAWMRILSDAGYVVLAPDSFVSRGVVGGTCALRDKPVHPDRERPQDAMGALAFLAQRPDIDTKRIALMGWSNGAMTGLWTVMAGGKVAPPAGAADFRTTLLFYPGCIDVRKKVTDYTPRMPTLIQMGAIDDWTLPGPCSELVEETRKRSSVPFEIVLYDGAYHAFDAPNLKLRTIVSRGNGYKNVEKEVHVGTHPEAREKAVARALDWLKTNLAR